MNRKYKLCTIGAFLLAIVFLFLFNVKGAFLAFYQAEGGITQKRDELENYLAKKLYGKNFFIEVSSIINDRTGFDIIGNFEFVRDDAGMMQRQEQDEEAAVSTFANSVLQLNNVLRTTNDIPMIVVQLPDRGENFIFSDAMYYHGKRFETVLEQFRQQGIDVLDLSENQEIRQLCDTGTYAFQTDAHLSTKAEFLNAKVITQYLEEKYSIVFPMTDIVYDPGQYDWVGCPFRGNFIQSCSDYFVKSDLFYMFYPAFETSLLMSFDGITIEREGDFSAVLTNSYDPSGRSRYWITNYGQYPSPLYTYTNKLFSDAPCLLIVCDSTMMRSNVFLTLNASCVTVADPRYFNGTDYLTNLLANGDYDAVIVEGCSKSFYINPFFS